MGQLVGLGFVSGDSQLQLCLAAGVDPVKKVAAFQNCY